MIRNIKVLGLALVAVFAFSAVAASAASAANGTLTSTGPVTLDGTEIAGQLNALTEDGKTVECPGSTITGHKYNVTPHELIPSGAQTITLTPDYNQATCVAIEPGVTRKATVTQNGCDYVLHLEETNGETDTYSSKVDIVCAAGQSILVHVYFSSSNENLEVCTITVGPQTGLTGAKVTDTTTGDLTVHGTLTGIHATRSGVCGSASTTEDEFHINATVKGTNNLGEPTSISLSHA